MWKTDCPDKGRSRGGLQEIGRSAPRADAFAKVTGAERFAADYYPANCLWIGVKRSAYPHARIIAIDASQAKCLPGVFDVLTCQDIKGRNRLGLFEKDQPVLAYSRRVIHSRKACCSAY